MAGRVFLLGVVGVFRPCPECREWRSLGSYSHRREGKCVQCYKNGVSDRRGHLGARTRTIVLTDKGRAAVAGMARLAS